MIKNIISIYFIFLFVNNSQGQSLADTIFLPEVRLFESKISTYNIGNSIQIIMPETLSEGRGINLESLITNLSSSYIKSYGALATPSLRGTSSSHTLVIWNGIPINSNANGLADFSVIYPFNFSEISLVYGGNSSVLGSGSIGGSIHLNTSFSNSSNNEFEIILSEGSYGYSSQNMNFLIDKDKLKLKGGVSIVNNENKFEYVNTTRPNNPIYINDYGKIISNNYSFDISYHLTQNSISSFSYWKSDLDREVPQNMTILFSDAKQYDKSDRYLLAFNYKYNNFSLLFKQAYLIEDFLYTEISKDIFSEYLSKSYFSDFDFKLFRGNYIVNLGSVFMKNQINNNNYLETMQNENTFSCFTAVQYRGNRLTLNNVLRKEWQTSFEVPYLPTLAFDLKLSNNLNLRSKFNRNFRSPTFNDKYWVGSASTGNINLKPEDAWNKEFGIDYKNSNINISVTAYYLNINDMILWQPLSSGIWMPDNIQEVLSRGIELMCDYSFNNISINANYSFTRSTTERVANNQDINLGKQLRYVPIHKGNILALISYNKVDFIINQKYNGKVITSYGAFQNNMLEDFFLTDLSVKYKLDKLPVMFFVKIKNLANQSYTTYENYPNPGREYLFTIKYNI